MELQDRLKMARLNAGFRTAKNAAHRLGIPYGTYSGHELGTRGVKKEDIERYAKAFDVSVSWLAFGIDLQKSAETRHAIFVGRINDKGNFEEVDKSIQLGKDYYYPPLPIRQAVQGVVLVESDALHGFAERNSLLYIDLKDNKMEFDKIGQPAMCTYDEDFEEVVIGRVYNGSVEGKYNIERVGMPTIRDKTMYSVAPIMAVIPEYTALRLRELEKPQDLTKPNLKGKLNLPRY